MRFGPGQIISQLKTSNPAVKRGRAKARRPSFERTVFRDYAR